MMIKPLYGSNRNVTVDNFFTSIQLVKELKKRNLTLIGTLRKNKPEIPVEFQSNKKREIGSSLFGFHDGLTLVSFVPKQNKAVLEQELKQKEDESNIKASLEAQKVEEQIKENKRDTEQIKQDAKLTNERLDNLIKLHSVLLLENVKYKDENEALNNELDEKCQLARNFVNGYFKHQQ